MADGLELLMVALKFLINIFRDAVYWLQDWDFLA